MQFIFTKLGSTLLVIALIAFGYFIYSALGGTTVNVTLKTNPDLESGLVGHWTFDGKDMISNVADVSGQGNHGALQGQTSTTTAIGVIGQALDFDGSDDYVNVGTVTGGGGGGSTATIDTTTNTLSIVRGSVRYIHYAMVIIGLLLSGQLLAIDTQMYLAQVMVRHGVNKGQHQSNHIILRNLQLGLMALMLSPSEEHLILPQGIDRVY